MADITIKSPAAGGTVLTTELNSLANAQWTVPSAAVTTALHLFVDFTFTAGGSVTPTAGAYIGVYIIPGGPTASYPVANTATVGPGEGYLAGMIPLIALAGTAVGHLLNVPAPAYDFKVTVGNFSGVALTATSNTLAYKWHDLTVA